MSFNFTTPQQFKLEDLSLLNMCVFCSFSGSVPTSACKDNTQHPFFSPQGKEQTQMHQVLGWSGMVISFLSSGNVQLLGSKQLCKPCSLQACSKCINFPSECLRMGKFLCLSLVHLCDSGLLSLEGCMHPKYAQPVRNTSFFKMCCQFKLFCDFSVGCNNWYGKFRPSSLGGLCSFPDLMHETTFPHVTEPERQCHNSPKVPQNKRIIHNPNFRSNKKRLLGT